MTLVTRGMKKIINEAVGEFWLSRTAAGNVQRESGVHDHGQRANVTTGKNMDGFLKLFEYLVKKNGPRDVEVCRDRHVLTLPGFFRPTKLWDILILKDGQLLAAIEMKSHVGPSFGNNFNNRAEEAIGTASDMSIALREGAFGLYPPPFLGWLILVEDAAESRKAVHDAQPHFDIRHEFRNTSYLQRYDLLCRKLVLEKLYTSAAVLSSPRSSGKTGRYNDISDLSGITLFATTFAAHMAASKARFNKRKAR